MPFAVRTIGSCFPLRWGIAGIGFASVGSRMSANP